MVSLFVFLLKKGNKTMLGIFQKLRKPQKRIVVGSVVKTDAIDRILAKQPDKELPPIEVMAAVLQLRGLLTYSISLHESRHAFQYEWFAGPGIYFHVPPGMPVGPCADEEEAITTAFIQYFV